MGHRETPDRNTLLVYWYLRSSGQEGRGSRAVQRALGFSSPSTAVFHLEKLVELGLVGKERDGHYEICKRLKFGLMSRFYNLGHWWIPKNMVYAGVTSAVLLVVLLVLLPVISWLLLIALVPGALSAGIQWYEALALWSHKPRFRNQERG